MIGLAKFAEKHRKALEYDLLRETGHEIDDVGASLSYGALSSFLSHLGPSSALAEEKDPENAKWGTIYKTNEILANIFDVLAQINANLVAGIKRKRAKDPPKYPRPGETKEENKFGFRAEMTGAGFRKWLIRGRRKHGRRN